MACMYEIFVSWQSVTNHLKYSNLHDSGVILGKLSTNVMSGMSDIKCRKYTASCFLTTNIDNFIYSSPFSLLL